jgi:hypothetical protein
VLPLLGIGSLTKFGIKTQSLTSNLALFPREINTYSPRIPQAINGILIAIQSGELRK